MAWPLNPEALEVEDKRKGKVYLFHLRDDVMVALAVAGRLPRNRRYNVQLLGDILRIEDVGEPTEG